MNTRSVQLDRALGAVIGSAIGDALGATLEFRQPRKADGSDWLRDIVGGGAFNWPTGATTDDTAMAKGILQMYLQCHGNYNQTVLVNNWLAWMRSCPPDIGGWTSSALHAWVVARTANGQTKAPLDKGFDGLRGSKHPVVQMARGGARASNGGVMRCIPSALIWSYRDAIDHASKICEDTHPHADCVASCKAVIYAAHRLIVTGGTPVMAWKTATKKITTTSKELFRALLAAPVLPWTQWRCTSNTVHTTQTAFAALVQARSFEEGLVAVVNRGDDADTTGAVAGGLLGAHFGYASIPARWKEKLLEHDELKVNATALFNMEREKVWGVWG